MTELATELKALCARHGLLLQVPPPPAAEPVCEVDPRLPEGGIDIRSALDRFENALILQALHRAGSKNGAARLLRMNRTTLVEKIKMKVGTDAEFAAQYTASRSK